jgi:DNA-binding transcriptional LysR family regulator
MMRPRLERILAEAEAAKAEAKGLKKLDNAPLNLGVMCTIGTQRLVGLIAALRRQAPGVRLTLTEAVPGPLIERLLAGELDCAFVGMPLELPERLEARTLYEERYVVAFPPGHRFEKQNAVRMADMDGEPYLWRMNCEFTEHFNEALAKAPARINTIYRSEREEWIQRMILAGLGCSFMPEHLVLFPDLPTRELVEPTVRREVKLATVAGRRHSSALAAFLKLASRIDWRGA